MPGICLFYHLNYMDSNLFVCLNEDNMAKTFQNSAEEITSISTEKGFSFHHLSQLTSVVSLCYEQTAGDHLRLENDVQLVYSE